MAGNWYYADLNGTTSLFNGLPSAPWTNVRPAPDPTVNAPVVKAVVAAPPPDGGTFVPVANAFVPGLQYNATTGQYIDGNGNPVDPSQLAPPPPPAGPGPNAPPNVPITPAPPQPVPTRVTAPAAAPAWYSTPAAELALLAVGLWLLFSIFPEVL